MKRNWSQTIENYIRVNLVLSNDWWSFYFFISHEYYTCLCGEGMEYLESFQEASKREENMIHISHLRLLKFHSGVRGSLHVWKEKSWKLVENPIFSKKHIPNNQRVQRIRQALVLHAAHPGSIPAKPHMFSQALPGINLGHKSRSKPLAQSED